MRLLALFSLGLLACAPPANTGDLRANGEGDNGGRQQALRG